MAATEESTRASRALDDLYRQHAATVYRYTYAVLGNHADAEDITQATFINALRALERGERPRKPSNWLLVIAHNLVRQRFRQAATRPAEVTLNVDVPQAEVDEDETSVDELVKALGRIPPAQREAIVMREFEGRSYAEICEILEVSTAALETLLFRARRSLAEELENVVTCARAEQDVSRLLDGRLSRRERRRLLDHIKACPSCSRFETFQRKQRRALKGLALLPLPVSLTLFKGVNTASAAGLPTIGLTTATTAATGGVTASGGAALGGFAVTGTVAKVAAVVAAGAVAAGGGYEGAKHIDLGSTSPESASAAHTKTTPTRALGLPTTKGPSQTAQLAHAKNAAKAAQRANAQLGAAGRGRKLGHTIATDGTHGAEVSSIASATSNRGGAATARAGSTSARTHGSATALTKKTTVTKTTAKKKHKRHVLRKKVHKATPATGKKPNANAGTTFGTAANTTSAPQDTNQTPPTSSDTISDSATSSASSTTGSSGAQSQGSGGGSNGSDAGSNSGNGKK